ncbi:MAG TPA: response regulator transcription factor [Nocardioides sp.]|nr:response regulator transcription factor [Nocardioides sp.]
MTTPTPTSPIRIAIVNDYDIVVAGVAAALAPYAERVTVVELDSGLPVVSDVDVILYDTFGQVQGDTVDLEELVQGSDARVVVFSWNIQPELVRRTIDKGASGYVSKASTAEQLVDAIEAVHSGTVVTPAPHQAADVASGAWPGQEHGLSARESEIIALITQGLSNQEIADITYLSINSVKTYIRTAYRKLGVTRRAQAVIWGVTHGFEPDRGRMVDRRVEGR